MSVNCLASMAVLLLPSRCPQIVVCPLLKDGSLDVLFLSPDGTTLNVFDPFTNRAVPFPLSSFLVGPTTGGVGIALAQLTPPVLAGGTQPHHTPFILRLAGGLGDVVMGYAPNAGMATMEVNEKGEQIGEAYCCWVYVLPCAV